MSRNKRALFLLSASARAHAQVAVRRWRPVIAVDGFADADLEADQVARAHLDAGQFTPDVLEVVGGLSRTGDMLAYGSGFEARPGVLKRLCGRVRVLGNSPDIVRLCADPLQLSSCFTRLGVPAPEVRSEVPGRPNDWLVKRRGRSGGSHVRPGAWTGADPDYDCWQRHCRGEPHSALFLAGRGQARLVGISRLLPAEDANEPYVWGGAIGPVKVLPEVCEQVHRATQTLAQNLGLIGICGIDFIVDIRNDIQIVDLNPRLVATCELYADCFVRDYMSAHVEVCQTGQVDGHLVSGLDETVAVRGMRVIYAPHAIPDAGRRVWPAGTADLPGEGARVEAGQPLCTVRGRYPDVAEARKGLQSLREKVLGNVPLPTSIAA